MPRAPTYRAALCFDVDGEERTGRGASIDLVWDTVIDNYLDPTAKNQDILFFGEGARNEYTYFKNSKVINGWKCSGGINAWSHPNGLHCDAGETSEAHSDGIQLRGQPVNGGWFISRLRPRPERRPHRRALRRRNLSLERADSRKAAAKLNRATWSACGGRARDRTRLRPRSRSPRRAPTRRR